VPENHLATTRAVNRFNISVLKLTGAPSLGDACVEDIDCTVNFGNHAECIIGKSGAGECGCRKGAHFRGARCYETACKYSTETLGLTSLQTLQSVSYKELSSLTSQLEVSHLVQNNGKHYFKYDFQSFGKYAIESFVEFQKQ